MPHYCGPGPQHRHRDLCCSPPRGWVAVGDVLVVLVNMPASPVARIGGNRGGRGTGRDRRTIEALAGR